MKEYHFLLGREQYGPFTIEELSTKELTNETLIWTDGMENWQKLKDIPELVQMLKPKSVPPPPPPETDEKMSKTEVSGQLKITTEKVPNAAIEAIKPNKKTLTWLVVWSAFNLFALLMSYSQIEIFNDRGKPKSDKFWPFVEFQRDKYGFIYSWQLEGGKSYSDLRNAKAFNGIFVNYDWTEFAFYVGGAFLIYLLVRISNKDEKPIKSI